VNRHLAVLVTGIMAKIDPETVTLRLLAECRPKDVMLVQRIPLPVLLAEKAVPPILAIL
jgi:hypothetical protein